MDRARRRELRLLNGRAWDGEQNVFPVTGSLDSSLKKNTAFIKRLRTAITPSTLNTFLQEIRSLSLHKYLSEIISACYDGLCKLKSPAEIEAGVEIVSALHQRFGPSEFTEFLGWHLGKGLATPDRSFLKTLALDVREKEEKDRISRQRVLLRVVTELWLVGVVKTTDHVSRPDELTQGPAGKATDKQPRNGGSTRPGGAEPYPLEVLKDLLGHDREHTNLPLLVVFVKAFSWDILGVKPTGADGRKTVEEDGTAKPSKESLNGSRTAFEADEPFASPELQEAFKTVLTKYFEDVKRHLLRDQKSIQEQARKNAEAYVKSGEVFEDRQSNFEKMVKAQERLVANAQVIADIISAEMPDLKDSDDSFGSANGTIGLVKTGEYLRSLGEGAGIWDDEDERRFYENLVDLKGKVPAILLEDGKKKKPDQDDQVGKRIDPVDATEPTKPSSDTTADDQTTSMVNKNIGAQVDDLLLRLPEMITKDAVDDMAIDFCFLNSKASRNRLVKALTEVPKGRNDLLPCWARLVATLGQYMSDVPKALVEHLDAEFRSLQRRKEKDFLGQVRLSNIRYLAELTKFGIVPEHVVFHCLKVSLDDFSRMNIEILCNLLEHCGRYLFRNPETSPRMATFLETLQRKKSVQHIGQQERMLIENAVYHVDPPERPAIEQRERTPMELFIRKLIYLDMSKRTYSRVLKQIRRLHWEENEVVHILEKVFTKPHKVKFGNIHLLAILLSALYRYHPVFVVRVIDRLLESIAFGLEQNEFRFYQRRIAEVKYLGELYNYRMLEHPVVFETLHKITSFGYVGGIPVRDRPNPFDPPDDYFRIRLVGTLLDTCGMFFNRGAAGKKLDYFMSFFQYYIYTKDQLPMEIEFVVQDMYALTRPQWKLASDLEEAAKVWQAAIVQQQKLAGLEKAHEADDQSSSSSSDEDNGDVDLHDGEDDSGSEEEDMVDDHESNPSVNGPSESEDETIVVTREEEEVDPEDEAEFEREYAKMIAESLESRKNDRKPLFDVPLPIRPRNRDLQSSSENSREKEDEKDKDKEIGDGSPAHTMAFSLLTKRGNRQQTRTVELPSDSTFAVAMRNQQQAEREEQQRIKNLVLNYDLRENEEDDGDDKPLSFHYHNQSKKQGKERAGQRVRKLQLSDVDWK